MRLKLYKMYGIKIENGSIQQYGDQQGVCKRLYSMPVGVYCLPSQANVIRDQI